MNNIHKEVKELEDRLNNYKDFISNIKDFQNNEYKQFNNQYFWFSVITEITISFMWNLLDFLNYYKKDNWKWHNSTQIVLLCNSMPFIYETFKNIQKWQNHISSVLNRTSFETLIRIFFISFYPNNYQWIFWKDTVKEMKKKWIPCEKFSVMNFLDHKLDKRFMNIYKILSTESHSSLITTLTDLSLIEKWEYYIWINMKWELDFSYNMNVMITILYAYLLFIDNILIPKMNVANVKKNHQSILDDNKYLIKFLSNYLEKLPHEKKLNIEVDSVFEIIKKLEK